MQRVGGDNLTGTHNNLIIVAFVVDRHDVIIVEQGTPLATNLSSFL